MKKINTITRYLLSIVVIRNGLKPFPTLWVWLFFLSRLHWKIILQIRKCSKLFHFFVEVGFWRIVFCEVGDFTDANRYACSPFFMTVFETETDDLQWFLWLTRYDSKAGNFSFSHFPWEESLLGKNTHDLVVV